ncbi:ABC transporter ATP-binding protein [Actinoplanes sp. L3-i22]|uniref:ABC transporter ATP-binding protein n=1 Tax=Actinoplanes sp. L3-i22 TaxID=2836373 RepID=UPI001C767057|nr:sn-glycerol-3-phosphate ABC transporter ATP-binding protein UgpC [Actinoplanes sp. L3-i22]BCY09432.1 sugar ABC transporter ATP-binding protein [Actinoplanes sp. L3-i22]
MSVVRLENLTKVFSGRTTAVDDVSLTIGDGEFLVLVGPSGCGKSTILRMIAGLEEATGGDVFIDDQQVTEWPPKQRDIAMVFQNYALYPHMTVQDNMGFALKLRRVAKERINEQVGETARLLGLAELLDRKPKALSGGQRQRVAMGRALVREPRVFLLDEPLSNLDAKLRVSMRAELARLHQRYRVTTVYVTHDQIEAMTLGDRIAVLNQGRLQQVGSPEEFYLTPANQFVAGFMGSPSMNFATVGLGGGPDRITVLLDGIEWEIPDASSRYPGLAKHVGSPVVLGLRPAALSLAGPGSKAVVDVVPLGVESLGDEKHVLFEAPRDGSHGRPTGIDDVPVAVDEAGAAQLWTAKVTQHADLAIGRPVRLAVDLSLAYFFEADGGQAICRREPAAAVTSQAA